MPNGLCYTKKRTEKNRLYNMPSAEYNATCEESNQENEIKSMDLIYLEGGSCVLRENHLFRCGYLLTSLLAPRGPPGSIAV